MNGTKTHASQRASGALTTKAAAKAHTEYATRGMAAYRAPSLLQPHHMRQAFRDAHEGRVPALIGMYLAYATPPIAKLAAQMGFDAVWIDWEHSAMNVETMTQMVHDVSFVSEGRSVPFVRIPGHDHAAMGYALDAGASIVVPQVETAEEAKHMVSAMKFGANINGTRSAPPGRYLPGAGLVPADPSLTLWQNFNQQAAVIIQVETYQACVNLDAILTEVGDQIDAVWLGSLDCRISMGLDNSMGDEPEWLEVVDMVAATLKKHDTPYAGFALGSDEQMRLLGEGKSLIFTSCDAFTLLQEPEKARHARTIFPAKDHRK